MMRTKIGRKLMSLVLCLALIMTYIPVAAAAAEPVTLDPDAIVQTVADVGTAHTWETMMGTDIDGNRYAGRVWVDKSVYKDGDTVTLNTKGDDTSSFQVELDEGENFQVVFSALGSTMTTKSTISASGPLDVVLVLDDSTSMDDIISGNTTRLEKLIEASNELLANLAATPNIRIGIVAYNQNSMQILPFGSYENGVELRVLNDKYVFDENNNRDKGGTIQAFDQDGKLLYNNTKGYARGTNTQAGIHLGMSMLENAQNTQGRVPVAIVLTDGAANTAAQNTFYNIDGQTPRSIFSGSVPPAVAMATLLTAAYKRVRVADVYGTEPMIYGVGVDIAGDSAANAVINPGAAEDGFNSTNSSSNITEAYSLYRQWLQGNTVRRTERYNGNYVFTFDHNYSGVTLEDIRDNINYVDTYYPVSSAQLSATFDQIYQELASGVFNPISSSTATAGGTGVDDTPLIYVDFIGQHMEIKEIQSVTLFGASYGVTKNANGTYTVNAGTGTNPTTNERWNTSEDITITITETEGVQKLEIRINQEILPIVMEQVISETVGDVTNATITELIHNPLRILYTVGLDSDILLPNGKVDISKLQGYSYIDDAAGTVSFYSNRFGVMNPDGINGDAHVGFQPSKENRYYYHQTNQGIFTGIRNKSGAAVTIPENEEYGIVWDEDEYELEWMTYEEYQTAQDTDKVYTYVTYHRPTPSTTDAANAAESVTYLIYTDWGYLKESAAFYDDNKGVYLNNGEAIPEDQVANVIAQYKRENPGCKLYAVLGVGSLRTSRLHNMIVEKTVNATGTAINRYDPEYTHETAVKHSGNSVVVWLGNNGKLTVGIDTGIALTKAVTESIGNADDTYELTVKMLSGVIEPPVVLDEDGNVVNAHFANDVLTVPVKAGQTVYVSGIPGGTVCEIGENVAGDYYKVDAQSTTTVTVPTVSEVLAGAEQFVPAVVTNAPYKYGDLHVTKEITSDHPVPESILATEFELTVNVGKALAGKTFTIRDSAHPTGYEKTVDADGNMTFTITARQTIDILRLPAGTAVTVTETAPGVHFAVSYRTRNHSGENADADNSLVIPTDGSATAVVINHYTPSPVSVDLDVVIRKSFADASVADRLQGGQFRFLVQKYISATNTWEDMTSETISYNANEYGEKSVTLADVLSGEVYSETGTYSYKVIEVKGDVANISYDRIVYTFDVVVTDNGGQLEAAVIGLGNTEIRNEIGDDGLDYTTVFTNTYDTAPVSMDIVKTVVNHSGDTTVSGAGFKFRSIRVDQDGNPLDSNEPETIYNSIVSDAAGEARISGVFTREQIGTHYFLVYETNDGRPGWTYSQAQYFVTVVVAETADGKLSSVMTIEPFNDAAKNEQAPAVTDQNKGQLYFTNTYDPENVTVDLDGAVMKVLTGMKLEADQFTFHVYEDGDRTAPILTGTNDLNGDVNFVDFDRVLTFDAAGTYAYDIVEYIPTGAVYDGASGKYVLGGMRYDPTIYDLMVEVTNNPATGKLEASCYFEDAVGTTVTYRNHYEATPTDYTLGGVKVLNGRAPRAGEFAFELYQGNNWVETVSNKADGSFTFKTIPYTQTGTYTYTIREVQGNVAGVTYTGVSNPVTVTVTVTDEGGVLKATADRSNAAIRFENTYTAKAATVSFSGTKTLVGKALEDETFTFLLYQTDNTFDITGTTPVATDENVDGKFGFSRSFSSTGTYYFVIVEDAADPVENVVYDRSVYRFAVNVSDDGNGQLRAVVTNFNTGVASGNAAAVSTAVSFTNATFDEVTEKEVYQAGNVTTQIDGQKVNAGDILTYFITYTNYTGADVVADIMDVIPNHTSYVEGSASHGGTYAGTHVNWILNVARGETVTVSFDVRVDETNAIVANTAVVRDGVNTYSTNEVVNHTVEDNVKKDVFTSAEPTVSIDGEKVYQGDELLYKVTYTNAFPKPVDIQITDELPKYTTYVEGSADNGGVYADGKLTWSLTDIPAWGTVTVAFKVTVNTGIGAQVIPNQAVVTQDGNTYSTNIVSNYTVEDEVEKDVFSVAAPAVSIDGKKVYEGDELVYTISYKNTADVAATVTITDAIPQYTTYVEDSADNGGQYDSGTITWTAEVAAGERITVSFKVTVNASIADKTIRNQASVVEGRNSYTTNEVTNYTVDDEVEKDVFLPQDLTVSIDGQKVYAGDTLVYKISYTNTADEAVTVQILDEIPAYTTYVEGSADNGGAYADGKLTWNLDVAAHQSVEVSFRVTVSDMGNVTILNDAQVIEGKNRYTTNEVSNYTVDDEVEKDVFYPEDTQLSIDGNKVYAGDILLYSVSYKNTDSKPVTVTITDTIPAYTAYVEGSADNGGAYADGKLTWELDVNAGETVTVTFRVQVENAGNVTIPNRAQILEGRNTYYTNEVSNYTVDDEVEKKVFYPEDTQLSIDGQKVYVGDTLVYAISYTNTATQKATVTITDTIPEHTAYVEGSADNGGIYADGKLTWELDVNAGETAAVTFKVTVKDNAKQAQLSNQAQIQEGRNSYTTNEVTNYTVDDEVEKDVFYPEDTQLSIDGNKVYAGDILLYAVTYENTDSKPVTVTITDTVPAYTTYVEGSADNSGVYADGKLTWNLPVDAGAAVTVTFRVTVDKVGNVIIPNTAQVVEGRNTYETNEVTNYTVTDEVEKNVFNEKAPTTRIDGKPVENGDTLIYTISYRNTDTQKATVTITDSIPQHTTYVDGSADKGGSFAEGKVTWKLDVEAGASVTVSFKVKVNTGVTATIKNQAQVVEGRNSYTTNEVKNPTEDPVVPTTPQTGDTMQIGVWFTLLTVSAGAILGIFLLGKKKEKTEEEA